MPATPRAPPAGPRPRARCLAGARGLLEECLATECGLAPPSTCDERCELQARGKYRRALERGASTERAAKRGQGLFRRCVKRCAREE